MPTARELTAALFEALARRDVAALATQIAPDAIWHFPGKTSQLAGSHRGHAGIFGFLTKVAALTGDTFSLDPVALSGEGDTAFFHFVGRGRREGRTLENPTCLMLRFADEKLIEAREWVWDLAHVEDFWA